MRDGPVTCIDQAGVSRDAPLTLKYARTISLGILRK